MKAISRGVAKFLCAVSLAVVCTASETLAQAGHASSFVISARAGGVNFISGDVQVRRRGATEWERLTTKDTLDTGDVVKTGVTGFAEVLLNPGSYVRLGRSTEFEMTDVALDALRVKLMRGSAIIEATGYSDAKLLLAVATPQGEVVLVKNGLYRLNVVPANLTEVAVHRGAARVSPHSKELVKGGKIARLSSGGGAVEVVKLDKHDRDELDLWSRERGETLARANSKLPRRTATALMASLNDYWSAQTFAPRGAVWFFNPANGCYTALPLYAGWRSPYGPGYDISYAGHGAIYGFGCRTCPGGNVLFPNPPGTIVSGNTTPNTGGNQPNPNSNPMPMPRPEPAPRDNTGPALDRGNDRQSPQMALPPL